MRRGVILVLLIALTGLALGACGGGGGGKSDTSGATDAQYVDALSTSILSAKDTPESIDQTDARCLATAIVSVYHAADFEHAHVSVKDARDPKNGLGGLSGPSESQAQRLGVGVQGCKVGDAFAASFVEGMNANTSGQACLTQRLDTDKKLAPFLGASMLPEKDIAPRDAPPMIDALVDCVDLGAAFLSQSGLKLTAAETACLNAKLEGAEVFKKFMARLVVGQNVTETDVGAATAPAMNECLTAERRTELGITNSGG